MKFSMGLFDSLFGEKLTMEIPHNDTVIKRTVTKKWLDHMETTGKVGYVIKAHILDPLHGELVEHWKVGEDISRETFEKFKDNNEIYVLHVYEKGEMKQLVLAKEMWRVTKERIERI